MFFDHLPSILISDIDPESESDVLWFSGEQILCVLGRNLYFTLQNNIGYLYSDVLNNG